MPGTLFVVATPIGNLEDLTFRALRTLREVDLIAAEDTRRTSKLLAHYEIRKPLISLRQHNEAKQGSKLVADLEGGKQVALVTDAGTPGIADPGARFVRLARQHQIKVVPIPGCSAITTALSGSGIEADQFRFEGFAPAGERLDNWAKDLASEARTVVFFETPHAIIDTIRVIADVLVDRPIVVWRELTKMYEESFELSSNSPVPAVQPKGEFAIVVGPRPEKARNLAETTDFGAAVADLFEYLTKYPGLDDSSALVMVASRFNVTPAVARKAIKRHKILVKQQKA